MGSNRFTWVLAAVIVIMLVITLINTSNKSDEPPAPTTKPIGPDNTASANTQTTTATADTTAETLKTVQAQYGEERRRRDQLESQVTQLLNEVNSMKQERTSTEESNTHLVNERLDQLTQMVTDFKNNAGVNLQDLGYGSSTPTSPAYDLDTGTAHDTDTVTPAVPTGMRGYVRLVPLTTSVTTNSLMPSVTAAASEIKTDVGAQVMGTVTPWYTIPMRATGFDATALTAMIGRVPVSGKVVDPFPVKLVLGHDNLAANGHHIPGLDGIILDGIAQGDWVLGCVSVKLTGGTYIFDDGSINHMSGSTTIDDSIETGVAAGYGNEDAAYIGYISDTQGVPCVRGKRLTDAYKQASWMTLLGIAKGQAEFKASAEQTTTTGVGSGTVTESVTGDKTAFSRYGSAATGLDEFMRIYKERFQDTFDAIYVPAGEEVAIHFTRDLRIDHRSTARKLAYDQASGGIHALD